MSDHIVDANKKADPVLELCRVTEKVTEEAGWLVCTCDSHTPAGEICSGCLAGGQYTDWCCNNAPLLAPPPYWRESWLWHKTTVESCAADLYAHWPLAFSGWSLDYIRIHQKPQE